MGASTHCPHCGSENVRFVEQDNWIGNDCDCVFVLPSDNLRLTERGKKLAFLSHTDNVSKFVERIACDLCNLGHEVWVVSSQIKVEMIGGTQLQKAF